MVVSMSYNTWYEICRTRVDAVCCRHSCVCSLQVKPFSCFRTQLQQYITPVHPVSVLIPYPKETPSLRSQTVRQRKEKVGEIKFREPARTYLQIHGSENLLSSFALGRVALISRRRYFVLQHSIHDTVPVP